MPNMQIIYNSSHYHVVEYANENLYEVIDKVLGMGGYFQGEVATAFRESLAQVIERDPTSDSVDDFLTEYNCLMTHPVRFH